MSACHLGLGLGVRVKVSLVSEIEARHTSRSFEGMPPDFKYIDAKDRGDMAKRMIEQQLQQNTVALRVRVRVRVSVRVRAQQFKEVPAVSWYRVSDHGAGHGGSSSEPPDIRPKKRYTMYLFLADYHALGRARRWLIIGTSGTRPSARAARHPNIRHSAERAGGSSSEREVLGRERPWVTIRTSR
ncbi:unnamed protein product [Pylaiella littoralis]